MKEENLDTHQKALQINLDPGMYGAIVEIGAGQEVARWFFRVGAAAGTVAKTMSAYDMQVSDAIYGKSGRYVSGERLSAMLDHEWNLILKRLGPERGAETSFFCFADTVSARNYHGTNICHGWMGVRFQLEPGGEPHAIHLHVNMSDSVNLRQQQAVGILGVNLIYAAMQFHGDLDRLVKSLLDDLSLERISVDYISLEGKAFENISGKHALLSLLRNEVTTAVAFSSEGAPSYPMSEVYKCPVVVERGVFKNVEDHHDQLLSSACEQYKKEGIETKRPAKEIFEITMHAAGEESDLPNSELLKRVEALSKFGKPVLITSYAEGYHLTQFLRRYTEDPIRFALGITQLIRLMDERYYEHLAGGFLEGMGRLLSAGVKLYVAPMNVEDLKRHMTTHEIADFEWQLPGEGEASIANVRPLTATRHLYSYLFETGAIGPM